MDNKRNKNEDKNYENLMSFLNENKEDRRRRYMDNKGRHSNTKVMSHKKDFKRKGKYGNCSDYDE
jgi:hypothetical protein